jgi:hypothetical protein
MRVFCALFPPDEVVEYSYPVVTPLRRHFSELEWAPPPPILPSPRAVKAERLAPSPRMAEPQREPAASAWKVASVECPPVTVDW